LRRTGWSVYDCDVQFAAPQWLLLIPVIALVAWRLPRFGLAQPMRAACALLVVLALARPLAGLPAGGMDLWVLVDRSASSAPTLEPALPEIERLLAEGRRGGDRLRFVDFASAPVERLGGTFEPDTSTTKLRLAVDYTLARRDSGRPARMLILTDGFSTEDLGGLAERSRGAGMPLDLRLSNAPPGGDALITSLLAPSRVQPGEGFLIEAGAAGADGPLAFELTCDGEPAGQGTIDVRGGRGSGRIAARSVRTGAHKYTVRLVTADDPRPGNDSASVWVEVAGGRGVLIVSAYADDPLAAVLRAGGFQVEVAGDPARLHPGLLTGGRVVVLNNVPAGRLPADFLGALDFFVRNQGGGLVMTGGRLSFGSGGYFESPLDPLLPVSMELREEHRKLSVAMAIVMDRSGSMAAGAGGGLTKMDLADEGAARAVEILGPSDAITVFAVDSEAHVVVPLTRIGKDSAKIGSAIRRVQSAGGGIYVYNGLAAAWKELKQSTAGQRHVILFADAADSEEPGAYQDLLAEMVAEGATVSVIGLGSPSDSDARLLEDIARLGRGRIFFNADASQIPGLFAQETVAIARSAFLTDPTPVRDGGGWREISPLPLQWPTTVDAYNLSYLRDGASVAALSGDDYAAPLVAFWQRGVGRTAAVSFPVAGELSGSFRGWPQAADFERTLLRWVIPGPAPAGVNVRTRVVGSDVLIDLLHDGTWTGKFAENVPSLAVATGATGGAVAVPWERIEPGRYSARIPLPPGNWLRGVVEAAGERWTFGPVAAAVDPEWSVAAETLRTTRDLCAASGGREIVDLRDAWLRPPSIAALELAPWLLALALGIFVVEIGVTRWAGRTPG